MKIIPLSEHLSKNKIKIDDVKKVYDDWTKFHTTHNVENINKIVKGNYSNKYITDLFIVTKYIYCIINDCNNLIGLFAYNTYVENLIFTHKCDWIDAIDVLISFLQKYNHDHIRVTCPYMKHHNLFNKIMKNVSHQSRYIDYEYILFLKSYKIPKNENINIITINEYNTCSSKKKIHYLLFQVNSLLYSKMKS